MAPAVQSFFAKATQDRSFFFFAKATKDTSFFVKATQDRSFFAEEATQDRQLVYKTSLPTWELGIASQVLDGQCQRQR